MLSLSIQCRSGCIICAGGNRKSRWISAWVLAFVAVAVTASAWIDIVRLGLKDEETSYVLVAPLVALWLGWVRLACLAYLRSGGEWIGRAPRGESEILAASVKLYGATPEQTLFVAMQAATEIQRTA